jgi:hypothetical protein
MVTVEYQVGASADDGAWISTTFSTNFDLQFGSYTAGIYKSFFRFTGVTIPDGATINSAYLSFYYSGKMGTPPACTLSAIDEANPSTITGYSDGNGRSLTTANISITGPESGTWWNSGSIVAIIEELLASNSYASGAAMMFLVVGSGSGQNRSSQRSYDYAGNTYGPKLHIEYTEAAAAKPAANVIWIG